MSGRYTSSLGQADHCRQLAYWTSDERTHHVLLEMAREFEARGEDEMPPPGENQSGACPAR
jgi:hypothetical protein